MDQSPTVPQSPSPNSLLVYVRDPEHIFFQDEALSLSSINDKGPFDVLPQHENFISIIKDKVVIQMKTGEKRELPLKKGVLKTLHNKVWIFLGLETIGIGEKK